MKYDMAGGAAVIGAMQAIARLKPPVAVTGIVPAVENMPGSRAQRPGDIVTSLSGKTIEVLNTDAEGRLILADAITYAKQLGCTHLVDTATLTGAIVVALGHTSSGVFTNDDELLERWMAASKEAGEKMWHMPLDDEYRDLLKTVYADIQNIGGRWGGACTAAMFLKEFVGRYTVGARRCRRHRLAGRCQAVPRQGADRHPVGFVCESRHELEVKKVQPAPYSAGSFANGFTAPHPGQRQIRSPGKRNSLLNEPAAYPLPHRIHTFTHVPVSIGSAVSPK